MLDRMSSNPESSFSAEGVEKREGITTPELGGLLAALGNHENKALLLAAMQPGVVYSRYRLHGLFMDIQGHYPAWEINDLGPFRYCSESLGPIGGVVQEVFDPKSKTIGYAKTTYGEQIGTALAGHMLYFSLRHRDYSLETVFGRTANSTADDEKRRSPIRRLEIFAELSAQDAPVSLDQLATSLMEDPATIKDQITSLAQASLVQFDSARPNLIQSEAKYQWRVNLGKLAELEPMPRRVALSKNVLQVLEEKFGTGEVAFNLDELMAQFLDCQPQYRDYKQKSLRTNVSAVLRHFHKQDGVINEHGFLSNDEMTHITVPETTRAMIEEGLLLLHHFQLGDEAFLADGRAKARDILSDPRLVNILVAKARAASTQANSLPKEQRINQIEAALEVRPEQALKELHKNLRNSGVRLSSITLRQILNRMESQGLIKTQYDREDGRVKRYSLIDVIS